MKKYTLYTSKEGTIGLDGEVNLRLFVTLDAAPQRLSDFAGGAAEIYDGYSTHTYNFTIELAGFDPRRIVLKRTNSKGEEAVINPEFIRKIDPADPLNQLEEIPLKLNQNLSGYIVRNSSWGLM
ncbi:hypothetical protein ACKC5O_19350 [Aeromonas schubertii]|uniref:hypothetical protein n=1 Tax=Aeromonas schubertii TaxID=652 RepID=UPI0038B61E7D